MTVDWDLVFENPFAGEAAEYWMTLCGARTMPTRSELRPAAMYRFLNFVNLVDKEADGSSYVLRLQSAHNCEVYGNIAHQKFSDLSSREELDYWHDCFDLVSDSGKPVRLFTAAGMRGKTSLDCEVFIAPLGDGEVDIHSLFWIFVSWPHREATTERGPRRVATPFPARAPVLQVL